MLWGGGDHIQLLYSQGLAQQGDLGIGADINLQRVGTATADDGMMDFGM